MCQDSRISQITYLIINCGRLFRILTAIICLSNRLTKPGDPQIKKNLKSNIKNTKIENKFK